MSPLRILLFGGHHQIGRAIQDRPCPSDWKLEVAPQTTYSFFEPSTISRTLKDLAPDLVINCDALTDIDYCEAHLAEATEYNFHAMANLAAQCSTIDAPLIHLSSAQVFDGHDATAPYGPDEAMNPLNLFGQTMMMGEEALRHALHWHVILRASFVFSADAGTALPKLMKDLKAGQPLFVPHDRIMSPTSALSVASALLRIAESILNGKADGFGTFHVSDREPVSELEFARAVGKMAALPEQTLECIQPSKVVGAAELETRPVFTALSGEKLEQVYGIPQHYWEVGLRAALDEIASKED